MKAIFAAVFSRHHFAVVAVCLGALVASPAAFATATLLGSKTDPTGFDGLLVGTTTYDVSFSTTTLDSTFTFGTTSSTEAADALALALNDAGVTQLANAGPQTAGFYLDVDNSLSAFDLAFCSSAGSTCGANSWVGTTSGGLALGQAVVPASGGPLLFLEAADFTPTSTGVPEPLTLSLVGAGLAGVGAMRRRKKKVAR